MFFNVFKIEAFIQVMAVTILLLFNAIAFIKLKNTEKYGY